VVVAELIPPPVEGLGTVAVLGEEAAGTVVGDGPGGVAVVFRETACDAPPHAASDAHARQVAANPTQSARLNWRPIRLVDAVAESTDDAGVGG
jgi:hypothetical protein